MLDGWCLDALASRSEPEYWAGAGAIVENRIISDLNFPTILGSLSVLSILDGLLHYFVTIPESSK